MLLRFFLRLELKKQSVTFYLSWTNSILGYILVYYFVFISTDGYLKHIIEINQKSDSREILSPFLQCTCPKISHQYAILTPSWLVPPVLLTLKRHLPVTKADVLLSFCTKIRKSRRSKLPGELVRMAY